MCTGVNAISYSAAMLIATNEYISVHRMAILAVNGTYLYGFKDATTKEAATDAPWGSSLLVYAQR
jgi:hypothetical protein